MEEKAVAGEPLRDYQQEMLQRLHQVWRKSQSVMVQMPTGTGKTHLMAAVICEYAKKGVLVVAHRRELIGQISQTLDSFGVDHGQIVSGKEVNPERLVQVASIQTLTRRIPPTYREGECVGGRDGESLNDLNPSLVIVDEAHHALAETYRMLWVQWPKARFLGLTATPCRLSGEPFTDLFDVLVQSWTVVEFIKKGWLSDLDYVSVRSDSMAMKKVASLNKRGADGDYQTRQMALVLDTPESIELLYKSYRKFVDGKKGILYAINQAHARHIADYYQSHGVNCCMIDANTPAGRRGRWVEDYRQGKIDVLVNVDIFSSGFDCPEVEFIQLSRPTLSLALYLQQIGRGMRVSEGKSQVTILDQVGLWLAFGLPTSDRNWNDMFEGKMAGKGRLDYNSLGSSRSEGEAKMLVNDDMYRIRTLLSEIGGLEKRKPQKQSVKTYGPHHLEVFKELGRYGIRREGETCLPAVYQQLEELPANDRFFGLAMLPRERAGGTERWTVIDMEGKDLNVSMAGTYVAQYDGVFEFRVKELGRFMTCLHDVDNRMTYIDSRLEKIGGLQFFRSNKDGMYTLRGRSDYRKKFRRDAVVYNDSLAIVDRDLFVKTDGNRLYEIVGYQGGYVIVKHDGGLLEIDKDGGSGRELTRMPKGFAEQPDFLQLGLQREAAMPVAVRTGEAFRQRPYQQVMFDQLRNLQKSNKRILLQTPTGTGKAWVVMPAIREETQMNSRNPYSRAKKVLIVIHKEELLGQAVDILKRCSITPRIMRPGFCTDWDRPDTTVVAIGFIQQHLDSIGRDYRPTMIVVDEAHLIPVEVYRRLFKRWPNAKYIGLTATPAGDDHLVLKEIFGRLVPSWSLRELIDGGWLKDVEYVDAGLDARYKQQFASIEGKDEHGDYPASDMANILDRGVEIERLCQTYLKHANGKRGVVCAINQEHAQHIAACYERHGVKAAVSMDLSTLEGRQQVENLCNGNLQVLVDVRQFSDGFRCLEIGFVQLACPTRLLTTYLHQVEFGMRIEGNGGEEHATAKPSGKLIVLDHVGAKETFGLPTDDRDWNVLFAGGKA